MFGSSRATMRSALVWCVTLGVLSCTPTDTTGTSVTATKLAIVVHPAGSIASGAAISPGIQVEVQDADGQIVQTSTNVTLAITPGTGATGAILGGSTTQAVVSGIATFSNLTLDKLGTGYTLTATATASGVTLTPATTNQFSVIPGAPTKLAITTQPTNATSLLAINPSIVVTSQDVNGNTTTNATRTITLALTTGTGTAGATLIGTATQSTTNGVASFANLSIDKAGTGYTITATAPSMTAATTTAFNVVAGAAAKLAFSTQPTGVASATSFSPTVQVQVQDASGNLTSSTNNVTLQITSGSGTSGASLTGTLTQAAVAGVATFNNIKIDRAGDGYTLTATAPNLTAVTSAAFSVAIGPPAQLTFITQPASAVSGVTFNPQVQVRVTDAGGNNITSPTSVTLSITPGTGAAGAALSGTATRNTVAGVATFDDVKVNLVGTGYTLTATVASLTSAPSSPFNVTVGAATKLGFIVQPTNTVAAANFSPVVQVAVQDAQGNTVTSATNSITLGIGSNPGSEVDVGSPSVAAVNGVAAFNSARINNAGNGYTLTAAAAGLTGATSATFNVATSLASFSGIYVGSGAINGVEEFAMPSFTISSGVIKAASGLSAAEETIGSVSASGAISMSWWGCSTVNNGVAMKIITMTGSAVTTSTGGVSISGTWFWPTTNGSNGTCLTRSGTWTASRVSGQLVLTTAAGGSASGNAFTTQPVVAIRDLAGNTKTTDNSTIVTMSVSSGATVVGTASATASSGVATFTNVGISGTAGTSYTLAFTATNVAGAFQTITPTAPVATAADFAGVWSGNVPYSIDHTSSTETGTESLVLNLNASGNAVTGTTSIGNGVAITNVTVTNGVLNFAVPNFQASDPDCSSWNMLGSGTLNAARTVMTFTFSGRVCGAAPATISGTGNLSKGTQTPVSTVTVTPSTTSVPVNGTQQLTVTTRDANNATLTGRPVAWTTSDATKATVSSTGLVTGVATGTVTITASSEARAGSSAVTVTAFGPASRVAFVVQPTNVVINTSIAPAVQACIQDAAGNTVTNATTFIALAIGTNPGGATLGGSVFVNPPTNGCATFSNLVLNQLGTGYTLVASSQSPITSATSSTFNVASDATPVWVQLSPTGTAPGGRYFHSAVYDSVSDRMIVFGGVNGASTVWYNDTWVLDHATGVTGVPAWSQLTTAGTLPPARSGHTAVYDPINNRMTIFDGSFVPTGSGVASMVNDVWVLSNANGLGGTATWTQLTPAAGPAVRVHHSAVYDPGTNRMMIFGGNLSESFCFNEANDTWVLSHANGLGGAPVWSQLSPTGGPPGIRNLNGELYDPTTNRMTVFWGRVECSSETADVWTLTNANGSGGTPTWSVVSTTGSAVARIAFSTIYDAASHRAVIFGGGNNAGNFSDLWVLSDVLGQSGTAGWTQLTPNGSLPGVRAGHTAVYSAIYNRMIIFGGQGGTGNDAYVLLHANGLP